MLKISANDYKILMAALYRDREAIKGLKGFKHGFNDQQQRLIAAYKDPNITTIICAWGRKSGKTEGVLAPIWETVLTIPNCEVIYVAPTRKLATDIIWTNKRLHNFLGKEAAAHFIKGRPNNRDLILHTKNDSYIRLMGSENYENANGLGPALIVYDEFKAFHPEFHRTMSMNTAAKGAKLIIIGTKADYLSRNRKQYNTMLEIARNDPSQVVIEAETFDNPMNHKPKIKKRIMDDIAALRAQGLEEVVQREYYNKIIVGGSNAIFPEFKLKDHVMKHADIMQEYNRQANEVQLYQIIDPATSSVFGGLFIAHNSYTGKVYVLDELYEKDLKNVGITKIFPKIIEKCEAITGIKQFSGLWYGVYDEAALWAANEIMDNYNEAYIATSKHAMDKEGGISIMKYLFSKNLIVISDNCINFIDEILSYKRDKNSQINKRLCEDHTIDCIFEDELVSTTKGNIAIKNISIGDKVYTNKGVDVVTDVWSKGCVDLIKLTFSDGTKIKCTKDHKVFTSNRGFIKAHLLTDTDTFDTLTVWKKTKYYIEDLYLGAIQNLKTLVIENTIDVAPSFIKRVLGIFTDMCMRLKKALYQKVIQFITWIITQVTTILTTCVQSLVKNMENYTKGIAQTNSVKIWTILDTLRNSGMVLQKALLSIRKLLSVCGKICLKLLNYVYSVIVNIKCMKICKITPSSVIATVRLLQIEECDKGKVYDLTTKSYSRFYVSGKLVHNCTRYFIQAANYTVNLDARASAPIQPELPYTRSLDNVLNDDDYFNMEFDIDMNLDDF